jgi:hypothetical protein
MAGNFDYNERLAIIQVGGDDAIVIFGINRSGAFTDLKSLELVVPMFCLVTGCVSARRDRRY